MNATQRQPSNMKTWEQQLEDQDKLWTEPDKVQ